MTDHSFESMRHLMVASQLRTTGVSDLAVVDAMRAVPRELYVPEPLATFAYLDRAVPLANGRAINLPLATGLLLTEAAPRPTDRVLLVGAASGYTAALLAMLVHSVAALEEDAALPAIARAPRPANVANVAGPLAAGWADGAPYDLVVIDGMVETIPQAIVDQLADGGRLVAGLLDRGVPRLVIGRRGGHGFGIITFADAEGVVLPGFAKPPVFSF